MSNFAAITNNIKVIYLCAKDHRLKLIDGVKVYYNDIKAYLKPLDFECDCLDVDIEEYDLLIATPPCNYWSKANYRRESSKVAQDTKHLLPVILHRFAASGKPYIVENVQNEPLMAREINDLYAFYWFVANNHMFFTNALCDLFDMKYPPQNKAKLQYGHRDDNYVVDFVFNRWLEKMVSEVRDYE